MFSRDFPARWEELASLGFRAFSWIIQFGFLNFRVREGVYTGSTGGVRKIRLPFWRFVEIRLTSGLDYGLSFCESPVAF